MKSLKRIAMLVGVTAMSVTVEAKSCMPLSWRDDKPVVQVAILLDTSNSMDGLIEQAKSQLWRVANDLAYSTRCGVRPKLEIALFEYGNDRLSRGENYVRQVLPFTTDLDLVSQKLFGLRTDGGQEYCGAVIKEAVQNLQWSKRDDVYKTIFIAGNEPFTQGPVYFRDSIAQATRQGIVVNTIFCGPHSEGAQTQWYDGSVAGRGAYLTIDQNRAVAFDPTPYDDEISRLGSDLNNTYVAYGQEAKEALKSRRRADDLAQSLPASRGTRTERALMKATPQYADANWDVVASVAKGQKNAEELEVARLPRELQGKSKDELERHMKDEFKKRDAMQGRLGELRKKREDYLAAKKKASPQGPATLDQAMRNAIRDQASRLEYKFDAQQN